MNVPDIREVYFVVILASNRNYRCGEGDIASVPNKDLYLEDPFVKYPSKTALNNKKRLTKRAAVL